MKQFTMITETDIQKIDKLIIELSEGKYQIINTSTGNPVTLTSFANTSAKTITSSIPQNIPQSTSNGYLFGAQHLAAESKDIPDNENMNQEYYKALENEIPLYQAYATDNPQGKVTSYYQFIYEGALSYTPPETKERKIQIETWKRYFTFELPSDDNTQFLIQKKKIRIPATTLENCIKRRALRPRVFSVLEPVSYEELCYKAGHYPCTNRYREIDIQYLIKHYGLSQKDDDSFVRDTSKFAKGDF